MHLPAHFKTATLPAVDGKPPVAYTTADPADVPRFGTLTALDLAHQGKILWQAKTPQPLVGGVVATAGGLVFTGEGDGDFDASTRRPASGSGTSPAAPASTRRRSPTQSAARNTWRWRPAAVRSGVIRRAMRCSSSRCRMRRAQASRWSLGTTSRGGPRLTGR